MKKIASLSLFLILLSTGLPYASDAPVPSMIAQLKEINAQPDETRLALLLEKSLNAYESVKDYKAIFHKTELDKNASLGPEEEIYLKFEKPFKIYMGWLNTYKKGLEVVYERGKHRGKLAIHKPGLGMGLLPVVFLDQNSPWVKEGSASYDIEDAGIGSFLTDFTNAVLRGQKEKKLLVKFSEPASAGDLVDVTFKDSNKDSGFFAYHIQVLFDAATQLPVKMRLFDWQDKPMGIYSYQDLKVNVGSSEEEFRKQIDRQLYKVYRN